jgi:hypothetical protein
MAAPYSSPKPAKEIAVASTAEQAFEELLDAVRESGRMVRGERDDRGAAGTDSQADGYRYALELLRLAIDFYCDQDWSTPRFIPFSSPLANHTGRLAIKRIQGGANPDAYYDFAVIDPRRTYRISGVRGNDCYLSFSFSGGKDGAWPDRTVATLNDTTITFGAGGEFEIVVGPDVVAGPDAVMTEPDMCSVIVRQYFKNPLADRRLTTLAISVEADAALDRSGPAERTDDATFARSLQAAAAFVRGTDDHWPFGGPGGNWFSEPLGYTGAAGALGTTDNCYCMGRWDVSGGEELVITTTPVACRYWSLQLWNHWGQSLALTVDDANYGEQIVNDATAKPADDGSVTIVVGAAKPDEPNWLNTFGWDRGTMIFRYMFPEAEPERPELTVRTRNAATTTDKAQD